MSRVPRRWRAFTGLLAFSFGMSSIWALASPLYSAPDEPSHVIRAVSIWEGDAFASRFVVKPPMVSMQVTVPKTFAVARFQASCWPGYPNIVPTCAPPYRADSTLVTGQTTSGLYPLGYLASVGWIGAISPTPGGVYLMRLWAALECSVVFASIGLVLVDRRLGRTALVGAALGFTPLAVSLAGSVNPNGFEIVAAIALWFHAWAWFSATAAREKVPPSLIVRTAVIAAALCMTRPVSPAIAAVILLVTLAVCRCNPLRLWRDRATWLAVPLIAAAAMTTVWWTLHIDSLLGRVHNLPPAGTTAFEGTFSLIGGQIPQMIGAFGWLDSGTSSVAVGCWLVGVIALTAIATLWGDKAERRGAGVALLLASLFPVAVGFPGYMNSYLAWQGRYSLPLMVGVPALAGIALASRTRLDPVIRARLFRWMLALVVIGQFGGLFWALKRVTVGVDGPNFWPTEMIWTPPIPLPMALLLIAFPVVCGGGMWFVARQIDEPIEVEPIEVEPIEVEPIETDQAAEATSGAGAHSPSSSITSI